MLHRPAAVYILASKTRVLYTGSTVDLAHRIRQHRAGTFPGFTRRYGVTRLVYFDLCEELAGAVGRERQIKGWTRMKKIELIESVNPAWRDLAEEIGVGRADPSSPPVAAPQDDHGDRGHHG